MKKILLASALLATIGIGAGSVYADSPSTNEFDRGYGHMSDDGGNRGRINLDRENLTEEERQERFDERQAERAEYREERIQLALAEGWITEEEAAERRAEFTERDRLHEENGFGSGRYHHGGTRKGYRRNNGFGCH